jgi:hypothetical protein
MTARKINLPVSGNRFTESGKEVIIRLAAHVTAVMGNAEM